MTDSTMRAGYGSRDKHVPENAAAGRNPARAADTATCAQLAMIAAWEVIFGSGDAIALAEMARAYAAAATR